MKFDMGATTLLTLTKKTSTSSDDLGALVRRLSTAAEPLEGKFNGHGRQTFDDFKAHTDEIAAEINSALAGVLAGIAGMDRAFTEGEQEMVEVTQAAKSSSDFESARFSSGR
ncbi:MULTISPECIES: hypothetical protein [Actinomyces]|uniref:WXG100 family type VII secretion target n=2 Tax=Actinomyces respiraculi TaxID=2744574 RepID=A0A7T0PVH8_9ACTO|nr:MULTISPECIES: hypothetical protein [Actinomyces]QPL05346.1 hypothetical protein ID810_11675 [Actinomyces respiraculi]